MQDNGKLHPGNVGDSPSRLSRLLDGYGLCVSFTIPGFDI